jgi:toxin ParE1/3/4
MRLRWTPLAADDLESIYNYVSENHPTFAHSTAQLLYDTVRSLRRSPERGRLGVEPGMRELKLPRLPYIIVYRVTSEIVEVIRIFHTAQDRRSH